MGRTFTSTDQLIRSLRKNVEQIKKHNVNKLQGIGQRAVARSRQTRNYKDRTFRAINNHFAEVVSDGQSKNITFRRADESTFDVTLESKPDTATLYIGNRMQYTVWVERLHGFNVMIQELPNIRRELPKELAKGFRQV